MKMSPSTFNELKAIINQFAERNGGWNKLKAIYLLGEFPRSDQTQDLWRRFRWDMLWLSEAGGKLFPNFDEEDLNDNHIDTALRRIVPDPNKPMENPDHA